MTATTTTLPTTTLAGIAERIETALSVLDLTAGSLHLNGVTAVGVWGRPDFSTGEALDLAAAIGVTNPQPTPLGVPAEDARPARTFVLVAGTTSDGIAVSIYADHDTTT